MSATMQRMATALVLLLAVSALTGCPQSRISSSMDDTLLTYQRYIRYGQWDAAVQYLAPEYLEENPITRLDLDRLNLFKVTAYVPRQTAVQTDGMAFQQVVEIRMFNKMQAIEKVIVDTQEWRYDEELKRWFLYSGLPDVTRTY